MCNPAVNVLKDDKRYHEKNWKISTNSVIGLCVYLNKRTRLFWQLLCVGQ